MMALVTPRNTFVAVLLLLLALLPVYCSVTGNYFLMSLFTRILILGMAAVSLNLINGHTFEDAYNPSGPATNDPAFGFGDGTNPFLGGTIGEDDAMPWNGHTYVLNLFQPLQHGLIAQRRAFLAVGGGDHGRDPLLRRDAPHSHRGLHIGRPVIEVGDDVGVDVYHA